MGKGNRKRAARHIDPYIVAAERKASIAQRTARILCFIMLPIMVLTLLVQLWSIVTMQANLNEQRYTAEEAAGVMRALPLGQAGIAVMLAGAVTATVFLLRRQQKLAWIGTALTIAAGVLFVLFTLGLSETFAYNALLDRGLQFGDLLLRHFTTLLTPLLLLFAQLFAHRAAKKLDVIALMSAPADDTPTICLQEISDDTR